MMYLLKVNIALILFYGLYKLLLSRDTFFAWRRIALLAFMVIATVLPLVDITSWVNSQETLRNVSELYAGVLLPEAVVTGAVESVSTGGHDWQAVLSRGVTIVYWCVVALLWVRFIGQLLSVAFMLRNCKACTIEGVRVHASDKQVAPFSFFSWICLNPSLHKDNELREVLAHETAHVKQMHSVDAVLGELMCVVLWYNPIVWLLRHEIRNNLEYLADNRVLREGYDTKSYQYHLLGLTFQKTVATVYNGFNVLPLKERIRMMNKRRTGEVNKTKYLLFVPVLVVLLAGNFVPSVEASETEQETAYKAADIMPKYPGNDGAMMKYLAENIQYPAEAVSEMIQGRVIAQFVVKRDGSIGEVKIVRSIHPLLDAEATRLIRSFPKFEPGILDGKPVDVWYTIPITFKLPDNGK